MIYLLFKKILTYPFITSILSIYSIFSFSKDSAILFAISIGDFFKTFASAKHVIEKSELLALLFSTIVPKSISMSPIMLYSFLISCNISFSFNIIFSFSFIFNLFFLLVLLIILLFYLYHHLLQLYLYVLHYILCTYII